MLATSRILGVVAGLGVYATLGFIVGAGGIVDDRRVENEIDCDGDREFEEVIGTDERGRLQL